MSVTSFDLELSALIAAVDEHRRTATRGQRYPDSIVKAVLAVLSQGARPTMITRRTGIATSLILNWSKRPVGKKVRPPSSGPVPAPHVLPVIAAIASPDPASLCLAIGGFKMTIAREGVLS